MVLSPAVRQVPGPVWVWLGWAVPVVSLWFPFQVVRDVRAAAVGGRTPSRLGWWWACSLVGLWASNQAAFSSLGLASRDPETVPVFEGLATVAVVAGAVLWIGLVREITGGCGPGSPRSPERRTRHRTLPGMTPTPSTPASSHPLAATPQRPPRAELHLHLEGTLEPELAFALADRNGIALPFADPAALRTAYAFTDLQSFLDLYHATSQVLRTADDFADLTVAYLRRAAAGGVRHAELMVDLQTHVARGVPLAEVVAGVTQGLADGEAELGVSGLLIAAFLRHRPGAEAEELLDDLLALDAPVAGVGLASTEVGFSAAPFAPAFAKAAAHGLRRTAHAAEEGPAWHVTEVLDLLGAERVDHGIRALEDPDVVARLVRDQVPLTVCPVSNVRLRAVPSLAQHPLPAMLEAGLNVSLNSDDPSYFGGYVDEVDDAVTAQFHLSRDQRADLAAASFRGSFLAPEAVARHVADVEEWRGGRAAPGLSSAS